jgi:hypothetical protein
MRITFLFGIIFVSCGLASFLIFDTILRIFYKNYHSDWIEAGRPYGFFFTPGEDVFFLQGWRARYRMCSGLIFRMPSWARNDPRVSRLLFLYRTVAGLSFFVWLALLIFWVYQI